METMDKSNYAKTHSISSLENFPTTAHFAVLIASSFSRMDQWSDMNNGQPFQSSTNVLEYVWFEDDEALNAWLLDKHNMNKTHKVIRVNPVEVKLHTTVEIK